MFTRLIVACIVIFTAVPANAGGKKRAAAIFLAAPELNQIYCSEGSVAQIRIWKAEHPKPSDPRLQKVWINEQKALTARTDRDEDKCAAKDGTSFDMSEVLIAAISKLDQFEIMGQEEVLQVAKNRMAARPLIVCFTDQLCLSAIGADLNADVVFTGELTQHGDNRVVALSRFENTGMKFDQEARARQDLAVDASREMVMAAIQVVTDNLFGVPRLNVSAQIGNAKSVTIEHGQRVKVGDAKWKVTVEGTNCKGIFLDDKEVSATALWTISDSSFAGRDLKVSCTSASLRKAEFTFSIVLPTTKPEPAADASKFKRDPACVTVEKQFSAYKENRGAAFAVKHAEDTIKGGSQQCKTDARLMLVIAKALLEVSAKDPFALGKAVQYYQEIAALVDQLDAEDQKKVDAQVKFFTKTFFPVLVMPDKEAGWSGSGWIAVEFIGFVSKSRKDALTAMQVYFAENEVDLPFDQPLYFPTMQNGDAVKLNGKDVRPAQGGILTTILVPPGKSEPLGIVVGAALAGAVGRGAAEGAYSRADLSVQRPFAIGPITASPRIVVGGVNAFGGVASGAEERWSHAGVGGLVEWPNTRAIRLCAGANAIWAFGRGFELDPELGVTMSLSKGVDVTAAWLRPFTFWKDARIAGFGLGLIRVGWPPK